MGLIICVCVLLLLYLQLKNPLTLDIQKIKDNLANPKTRGSWGEKIAEDLLKQAGFKENVHYQKQATDEQGNRPDFSILLPNNIRCNMDSKFPLTNYMEYCRTGEASYITKFLKDFRDRIKEVSSKSYIDTNTTDFAICFIPNEQILNFALEHDPGLMDFALSNKIIVCSPWSLYSTIAIIKQVSHLINLDKESLETVTDIRKFAKEWTKYKEEVEKLEKRSNDLNTTLDSLKGVRTRQLEKTLKCFGE